ncbi:Asp23/Gls24 family envelope stress response protein [Loigolactobacillus iwatensis]|uniref:Asp23/Gls24 family envelope stress response protein n=1 Tax=Loigolactobacillus iwatensis TaxID=1267156 RepID=UPI000F7F438D|nr:Asp23/Gls24 family envelope stress response protein [Loigolactobacillus iwatensis]
MAQVIKDSPKVDQVESQLVYTESVLAKIVGKTINDVPGILSVQGNVIDDIADRFRSDEDPTKGVKIDLDNDNHTATVDLETTLEYGKNAPRVFDEAIHKIQEAISNMTDVTITEIKMTVKDMLTKEEWRESQNQTQKDKDNQ